MKKFISIFLIFILAINFTGCTSSEEGVEKYLEEKYDKDFVIERVAHGYFWYYMKDEPQYHYKGRFGNKKYEDYQKYGESFYYDRNCRMLSDYINEKLKEENINGIACVLSTSEEEDLIGLNKDIDEIIKKSNFETIVMYVCFSEKIGDINSENVKNVVNNIYEYFSEYSPKIKTVNRTYIFADEDFSRAKKYFRESGAPVSSEFRNSTNNFTIISNKDIIIENNIINIIN
jgi:hypothetical protein